MEQFYFLAVLLNILIGFILFYKDKALSCEDTLEKDDDVSFLEEKHGTFEDLFSEKSFLTSSKVQFVLGCSGIIVSVMLLLSPFSGIFLFGDLIPAIVCLAASVSMLINSYFEDSITDLKLNDMIKFIIIDCRKYVGLISIIVGIIHFVIPGVIFL